MKRMPVAATIALCVAACSSQPSAVPEAGSTESRESAAPVPVSAPDPPADAAPVGAVLTLEGLGQLRIGEAVPARSGWAERGAQISDLCRTVSSPDFPGVYAIVEEGEVRRVTVGERSDVTLTEGLGVGADEAEVRAAFPGFREEPHVYVEPPAKYLTDPEAEGDDPAVRFEIGADGRVSLIHVGTMPVLGYVEGCA